MITGIAIGTGIGLLAVVYALYAVLSSSKQARKSDGNARELLKESLEKQNTIDELARVNQEFQESLNDKQGELEREREARRVSEEAFYEVLEEVSKRGLSPASALEYGRSRLRKLLPEA